MFLNVLTLLTYPAVLYKYRLLGVEDIGVN